MMKMVGQNIDMLPSPNKISSSITDRPFCIIGSVEQDVRIQLFQEALRCSGFRPARFISYHEVSRQGSDCLMTLPENTILRIESPHRDFQTYRLFLEAGLESARTESECILNRDGIENLSFDKGLILYPRQWYLGFCNLLGSIQKVLEQRRDIDILLRTEDILLMFDKVRCQETIINLGVKAPALIGEISNYDHLVSVIEESGFSRVFVKLRHGSSASGVIALQKRHSDYKVLSTVEMVDGNQGIQLYNTRKLHCYTRTQEISQLINALCKHHAYAEAWFPKIGLEGNTCDCRVVFIHHQSRHVVVRSGKQPITNLHLGCSRSSSETLMNHVGLQNWDRALDNCRLIADGFPHSLYWGADFAFSPDGRTHAVFEVNAFGDLLKDIWHQGKTTYEAELGALKAFIDRQRGIRAVFFDLDGTLLSADSVTIPNSQDHRSQFSRIRKIEPDLQVHLLLSQLQEKYRLVLVSNGSSSMQHRKIKAAGLNPFFSATIISGDVRSPKPRRVIFQQALDRCGCSPQQVLFVGDDPITDISGAHSAGMRTCWISHGRTYPEEIKMPDYTIDSLPDLRGILPL
jgi:HAD superfamily hydrolase (TIGR01662 family)